MRILVVEDDRGIADFVRRGLEAQGYAVTWVENGTDGEARALSGEFDLVLLDLRLPGKSGLDVLRAVRAQLPELPIIVLTALAEVEDKVEGLDLGANDYVTKPFALDELTARVRAHLRQPAQVNAYELRVGSLALDFRTRRVERDGAEVRLTAREFDLLAHLMRHPDQVLSRTQLLSAVWGYDFDPGTNVVDVYVGYLRRKLAPADGASPIETIRTVGYRLVSSDA